MFGEFRCLFSSAVMESLQNFRAPRREAAVAAERELCGRAPRSDRQSRPPEWLRAEAFGDLKQVLL